MRASLTFNLNNPDDAENHQRALQGLDCWLVLCALDNYLRNLIKNPPPSSASASDLLALEDARDYLHEELADRSISL